eukprot:TRINITY_DN12681_c0_g1_i1.p1 TRINITY_DN12681_c0_g1~~TRINITY_DN12681_c0_g1_i1.p1  ORF type:complete len:270 (+),score=69.25 TRINITY_DN12681_c0_g1_i1:161-970(+)
MPRRLSVFAGRFRHLRFSSNGPSKATKAAIQQTAKMIGTQPDEDQIHKRMISKLQAEEYSSPLMDRICQRVSIESQVEEQEQEVLQEIAGALRRTEGHLLMACLELEVAGHKADAAAAGGCSKEELKEAVDHFNALIQPTLQRRYEMTVHRQSCGFRTGNYNLMEQLYPIPPPRRPDNSDVEHDQTESARARHRKITSDMISWRISRLTKQEWEVFNSLARLERHQYVRDLLEKDDHEVQSREPVPVPEVKPEDRKPIKVGFSPGRVIL